MSFTFRLGQINCRRCWRPLTHCACDAPSLLPDEALARLDALRQMAEAGCYAGPDDTHTIEQQRWAFLLYLIDHGKVGID